MTDTAEIELPLADAAATDRLGRALAARLGAGTAVLLSGPVGVGKTHLARALIRAAQASAGRAPEDVPSPTYTLVQCYEAGMLEIWHADLYRLSTPDEVFELGLADAFERALVLVEWPDRLGRERPEASVEIALRPTADGAARTALIRTPPDLAPVVEGLAGAEAA